MHLILYALSVLCFLLAAPMALAQDGDHVHPSIEAQIEELRQTLQNHDHGAPTEPPGPAPEPGPGPMVCSDPNYLICEDFESGPRWSDIDPGDGSTPPQIIDGALRFVHDSATGPDMGGSVRFDHAQITTVGYVAFDVRWEIGFHDWWHTLESGKGWKLIQWVAGTRSCNSTTEVNLVNAKNRNVWAPTHMCDGRSFEITLPSGDFNIQPKSENDLREYTDGACTYRHFASNNTIYERHLSPKEPNCEPFRDGVWQRVEYEVTIGGGVRLWVDGKLISSNTKDYLGNVITGYLSGLWLATYNTGHTPENKGSMIHEIDNLIVSTSCIYNC